MKTEFEGRTKLFALELIKQVEGLPKNRTGNIIANQILRSGTSIGANYREANRGESLSDFIHKIGIATKEAAETQYWLELISEAKMLPSEKCDTLKTEINEIIAILVTIGKRSRAKK